MNKLHRVTLDIGRIVFWLLAVFIFVGMIQAASGDVSGFMRTMLDTAGRLPSLFVLLR